MKDGLTLEQRTKKYNQFVHQRVLIVAWKRTGHQGIVRRHLPQINKFWVYMDEPYKTGGGKTTRWLKTSCHQVDLVQ